MACGVGLQGYRPVTEEEMQQAIWMCIPLDHGLVASTSETQVLCLVDGGNYSSPGVIGLN